MIKQFTVIYLLLLFTLMAVGCRTVSAVEAKSYFIENMRLEKFEGKGIKIIKTLEETSAFSRYHIAYYSQGLRITGMMNVPKGKGPFPVVILNHGHYDPKKYSIGLGFKDAADSFAKNGYIAVGSDFRNNGGSDTGDDFFQHIGSLYDVLYLAEAVKELPYADKERIGMWGYSGGGWLTLKASVINKDIKVIALFGSMSSDDKDNYYALKKWHPEVLENVNRTIGTPEESPDNYARLSPVNSFNDLSARVIIHHGENDKAVPLSWSEKLKETLIKQGKTVEFYTYPGQEHVLKGRAWDKAMERTLDFFNRYLKE